MPSIYQINARTWTETLGKDANIAQTPTSVWQNLKEKGIDYVWLMGVWETSQKSIEKYCFHPDLVQEYDAARPNWKRSDVGGSPYAIEAYSASRLVGQPADLTAVKSAINAAGLKLILDFIPNHFNAETSLLNTKPELFFSRPKSADRSVPEGFFMGDSATFAHGRDPYFAPWTDTVQLNYFHETTHRYMLDILMQLTTICDGVRCDMAMLILPDIFEKTWGHLRDGHHHLPNFWQMAIAKIKEKRADFLFMAEVYWDTEWRLQQDGFDFTYDKKLLDLMLYEDISQIKGHLGGDFEYHRKMVHFIENHDEQRSHTSFGFAKAMPAAVAIATLPGMTLYFDGQWQGARTKLPVQLAAPADELQCPCAINNHREAETCQCLSQFYSNLLKTTAHDTINNGTWELIKQDSLNDILAWSWSMNYQIVYVFINLTGGLVKGSIDLGDTSPEALPSDILNLITEPNYIKLIEGSRWLIVLPPYRSTIVEWT